jgi:hypothetical protein
MDLLTDLLVSLINLPFFSHMCSSFSISLLFIEVYVYGSCDQKPYI